MSGTRHRADLDLVDIVIVDRVDMLVVFQVPYLVDLVCTPTCVHILRAHAHKHAHTHAPSAEGLDSPLRGETLARIIERGHGQTCTRQACHHT